MDPRRLNPWIGGETRECSCKPSQLVSPIDETIIGEIAECDAGIVAEAAENAHAAFLANRERTPAERAQWLNDAATRLERVNPPFLNP